MSTKRAGPVRNTSPKPLSGARRYGPILCLLVFVLVSAPGWLRPGGGPAPVDPTPAASGTGRLDFAPVPPEPVEPGSCEKGRLETKESQLVLSVQGAPEEMGRQHGTLLRNGIRMMLRDYVEIGVFCRDDRYRKILLARVRRMKSSLPEWYLRELSACAQAAQVDEDMLLLAQCEGDIQGLSDDHEPGRSAGDACSAYVAFGSATADGNMRVGRNFDYWAGPFYRHCALVMYVTPAKGDGHPFVSVGWAGVLGGWTLVNSRALIVANHLGGGFATNPKGIPTLIMSRILAQKAGTVAEGIEIIRKGPRMRGQIIWMAQPADPATKRPARAVAVEYDADRVCVREAVDGVLVVTNQNGVFDSPDGVARTPEYDWGGYGMLMRAAQTLKQGHKRIITVTASPGWTLHSVEVLPESGVIEVAHGISREMPYVRHPLPTDGRQRDPRKD